MNNKSSASSQTEFSKGWDWFQENWQPIGLLLIIVGGVSFAVADFVALSKDLQRANRNLQLAEERTKKAIERAKIETADRFLLYRYGEEFRRYQKQVGIKKREEDND